MTRAKMISNGSSQLQPSILLWCLSLIFLLSVLSTDNFSDLLANLGWYFLHHLVTLLVRDDITLLRLEGIAHLLLLLATNFVLNILAVFDRNIPAELLINELLLESGHLLAVLHCLADTGASHRPGFSVYEFVLADILRFVVADCLSVGDVLEDLLNAALVGHTVHTHKVVNLLTFLHPAAHISTNVFNIFDTLVSKLRLTDDFVDGFCLCLLEHGGHLRPAVRSDSLCEELRGSKSPRRCGCQNCDDCDCSLHGKFCPHSPC